MYTDYSTSRALDMCMIYGHSLSIPHPKALLNSTHLHRLADMYLTAQSNSMPEQRLPNEVLGKIVKYSLQSDTIDTVPNNNYENNAISYAQVSPALKFFATRVVRRHLIEKGMERASIEKTAHTNLSHGMELQEHWHRCGCQMRLFWARRWVERLEILLCDLERLEGAEWGSETWRKYLRPSIYYSSD